MQYNVFPLIFFFFYSIFGIIVFIAFDNIYDKWIKIHSFGENLLFI